MRQQSTDGKATVARRAFAKRLKQAVEGFTFEGEPGTQAQLAVACKTKPTTVNKWYLEQVGELGAENLIRVARACGVSPVWLALGEGQPRDSYEEGFNPRTTTQGTLELHLLYLFRQLAEPIQRQLCAFLRSLTGRSA